MKSIHRKMKLKALTGVSLFALFPVVTNGAGTPQVGNQSIVAGGAEAGDLSVSGGMTLASKFLLSYFSSPKIASFDLTEAGGFSWRNLVSTSGATDMMDLALDHSLALYRTSTSLPGIVLLPESGQISLPSGGRIISNGNTVMNISSAGSATFPGPVTLSGTLFLTGSAGITAPNLNGVGVGRGANSDSQSVAVGTGNPLGATTTGTSNTALGNVALYHNTSGSYNTAVGFQCLVNNISGARNVGVGSESLYSVTIASDLVGVGDGALANNTSGSANTALGSSALVYNVSGTDNSAVGKTALFTNSTGNSNSAVGSSALFSNVSGSENTAIGFSAQRRAVSGSNNTVIGSRAFEWNISGNGNVAIGEQAGIPITNTSTYQPSNGVYIGYQSRSLDTNDNNSIVIGALATGEGANKTVIGNSSTVRTHLWGQTYAESLNVDNQVIVEAPTGGATPIKGLRVMANGTVLVRAQGDIGMGGYTNGPTVDGP